MPERRGLFARLFGKHIKAQARELAGAAVKAWVDQQPRLRADVNTGAGSFWGGWSRSTGGKWPGGQSKPIGGKIINHWGLRQQARDIVEDSVHAYTLVHRKADTIIDRGLTLAPAPIASILGMTEEQADEWAQDVAQAFDLWANATAQHRSGLFNFHQAQHQLMVGKTRDNDEFVRLYYSQRSDLLSPLQWEIIDANQIRGDALTATNLMPIKFYDGIVRNPDGSEKAYRIWIQPPADPMGSPLKEVEVPRIGEKSGRVMMLHGFQPEYAGQGRGYSQLGVTVQEFENLEDYVLSEIKKAINQSQLIGMVKPSPQNPASNPFESLGMPPAGPAPLSAFGATPAPAGISVNASIENASPVSVTPLEEAAFNVPGSTLVTSLAEGEELKFLQNTSPTAVFEKFVDAFLSPLLGAHSMSLEMFKIKFEASYSAARGALAVLWRLVEMERKWLDTWCLGVVYEMWLSCEIAAGRVSCPGWADPRLRAAWKAHTFIGTPAVQIDPDKEASAAMKYLQMSATNLDRVTQQHGGGSTKANIARNRAYFKELPIPPWENKAAASAPMKIEGAQEQGSEEPAAPAKSEPPKNGNGAAKPKQFQKAPAK